jgi:hypothetical protein
VGAQPNDKKPIKDLIVFQTLKLNLSSSKHGGPSARTALALTLGVSVMHAWLLAASPAQLAVKPAVAPAVTLQTRTVPGSVDPQAPAQRRSERPAPPAPAPEHRGAVTPPQAEAATLSGSLTEPPEATPIVPLETAPEVVAAAHTPPPAAPSPPPAPPAAVEVPAQPNGAATPTTPEPVQAPAQPLAAPGTAQASTAVAVSIPGSIRLRYQVTGRARGFELTASGQLDWQHDGQRYQSRLAISSFPLPSRIQTSTGEITPEGLSPRRFSDRTRNEVAVHFQPELGRVVFSNNSPQATWTPGVQDRLSVLLQLSAMIAGEPARFEPGSRISLPTAGGREVEPWDFTVVRRETLKLPIGEQAALLLRREPRHTYDQTVEVWFAPALAYLPVRLVLTQANGDQLDQQLSGTEKP